MRMFKKEEGFTLVELMVVVLIIGILVAIAIPVFNAARGSAQERTCQSNMRVIEGAVQQYLAANVGTAEADLDGNVDGAHELMTAGGEYIKAIPFCPSDEAATKTAYALTDGITACPLVEHDHY